jgi:hypothetical protein
VFRLPHPVGFCDVPGWNQFVILSAVISAEEPLLGEVSHDETTQRSHALGQPNKDQKHEECHASAHHALTLSEFKAFANLSQSKCFKKGGTTAVFPAKTLDMRCQSSVKLCCHVTVQEVC